MDHPVPRYMMSGGFTQSYQDLGNGTVCIPDNKCFCKDWLETRGSDVEQKAANALQWFAFALSIIILTWYAYAFWKATCGWEEVYVCTIESEWMVVWL